jgi:hypothetical protein
VQIEGKKEELVGEKLYVVLKVECFGKQILNALKVSKFSAGEGWRTSVGPIV